MQVLNEIAATFPADFKSRGDFVHKTTLGVGRTLDILIGIVTSSSLLSPLPETRQPAPFVSSHLPLDASGSDSMITLSKSLNTRPRLMVWNPSPPYRIRSDILAPKAVGNSSRKAVSKPQSINSMRMLRRRCLGDTAKTVKMPTEGQLEIINIFGGFCELPNGVLSAAISDSPLYAISIAYDRRPILLLY
jgi:hypothetical protein